MFPLDTGGDKWRTIRTLVVVLITFSAALTAIFADASLTVVAGATLFGFGVSLLVVVLAFPRGSSGKSRDSRFEWD